MWAPRDEEANVEAAFRKWEATAGASAACRNAYRTLLCSQAFPRCDPASKDRVKICRSVCASVNQLCVDGSQNCNDPSVYTDDDQCLESAGASSPASLLIGAALVLLSMI